MKKIIGFFDTTLSEKLPFFAHLNVVYEEDGKHYIQYIRSRQFISLTMIICDLKSKEEIEKEVQAYLNQEVSPSNKTVGHYENNEDLQGNKVYFGYIDDKMLKSCGFYPIEQFTTYIQSDITINEETFNYALALDGTNIFVGDKDYIYRQILVMLEYPFSKEEWNFKINMLYDLEKFDELSDVVDKGLDRYNNSTTTTNWCEKKENGQKLKLVYQRINHNCD